MQELFLAIKQGIIFKEGKGLREIKYRGYYRDRIFDRVLASCYKDGPCAIVWMEEKKDWVHYDGVLVQFIGARDKNGEELYEDDIVESWSQGLKGTFVIKWRQEANPCWILYPAWQKGQMWNLACHLEKDGKYYDRGITKLGNIHQNPELLKKGV